MGANRDYISKIAKVSCYADVSLEHISYRTPAPIARKRKLVPQAKTQHKFKSIKFNFFKYKPICIRPLRKI